MKAIHKIAFLAASLAASLISPVAPQWSSLRAGDAIEELSPVSGVVSFELEPGARRAGLQGTSSYLPGLARALDSLRVFEVRPYFVRPFRAPRSSEEERLSRIYQAEYTSPLSPLEAARLLAGSEGVRAASAVPLRQLAGMPSDTRFAEQWGFRQAGDFDMDLPEAWDVSYGDRDVVIAVLDTGLDRLHPDLGGGSPGSPGNVWVNDAEAGGIEGVDDDSNGYVDDIWGWDWVHYEFEPGVDPSPWPGEDYLDEDGDPADFYGHGTAVAGVAGAIGNNGEGVAGFLWNCRIMGLRCGLALNSGGGFPSGAVRMDWCARAVAYAADMGAAAINASWESGFDVGLEAAVDYAISRGVVVSVAAGNRGVDPANLAARNYLSSRGDCMDVAAVRETGDRWANTNFGGWVDISAPGSNILTLRYLPEGAGRPEFHGYGLWNGTSFAAPAVAACAALLRSRHQDWSAGQIMGHLKATSMPLDPPDPLMGAGLMNAFEAIRPEDGGWSVKLDSPISTAVLPLGSAPGLAAGLADGRAVAWTPRGDFLAGFPVKLGEVPLTGVAAGDLDGDGEPELVLCDESGRVSVLEKSGAVAAGWDAGSPAAGEPALVDLDGDEAVEIVLTTVDYKVHAWSGDGTPVSGWPVVLGSAPSGQAAVGDLDGDEVGEAVVACVDGRVHCLRPDGGEAPGWPVETGASVSTPPSLGDLRGDDDLPEVLLGVDDGRLFAWDAAGDTLEGWPFQAGAGGILFGVSLGDVDGDSAYEAAATGSEQELILFDSGGFPESGWPLSLRSGNSGVLIADVDGDSIPELLTAIDGVGIGAWDLNGVKCFNWPKPTDGEPSRGIAYGDFDEDGRPEVLAASADGWLHCWDLGGVDYVGQASLWPLPGRDAGNTRLARPGEPSENPGNGGEEDGNPFKFVSVYAAPNPTTTGTTIISVLAGPEEVLKRPRLRVFDAAGRLVRELRIAPRQAGTYRDYWDGRTEEGRRAPSGVYICVASVDDDLGSCAIVLVR